MDFKGKKTQMPYLIKSCRTINTIIFYYFFIIIFLFYMPISAPPPPSPLASPTFLPTPPHPLLSLFLRYCISDELQVFFFSLALCLRSVQAYENSPEPFPLVLRGLSNHTCLHLCNSFRLAPVYEAGNPQNYLLSLKPYVYPTPSRKAKE